MVIDIYFIIGWIGVFFILLSYILLSAKKLKKDYLIYHLLNFIGAAGLVISTFISESWPALALSLIFAVISIFYIVKLLTTKNSYKELRAE